MKACIARVYPLGPMHKVHQQFRFNLQLGASKTRQLLHGIIWTPIQKTSWGARAISCATVHHKTRPSWLTSRLTDRVWGGQRSFWR